MWRIDQEKIKRTFGRATKRKYGRRACLSSWSRRGDLGVGGAGGWGGGGVGGGAA